MNNKDLDVRFWGFDPDAGPDPTSLTGILEYVEGLQEQLDRVTDQLGTLQRRDNELRDGLARLTGQMQRARQMQDDLLPRRFPTCDGLKISKLYLPADELSGDTYDVVRLDVHQVAVHISDATGHGLAAAMLSAFMRQSMHASAPDCGAALTVYPHELLATLNRELIGFDLSECDFVTSLHAIYDEVDNTLLWARGGMPYPIRFRHGQPPESLVSRGGLIGVFDEQAFDLVSTRLGEGDMMMMYTDGLEALLASDADSGHVGGLINTTWCRTLTPECLSSHLAHVEELARQKPRGSWPVDDITVLILERTAITP